MKAFVAVFCIEYMEMDQALFVLLLRVKWFMLLLYTIRYSLV